MKWMNEKTVDELKKQRRNWYIYQWLILVAGTIYLLTGVIAQNTILVVIGSILLVLVSLPSSLSLMIYLKEHEK